MRRIQSVIGRIVEKLLGDGGDGSWSPPAQVHERIYCGWTFASRPDRCPECGAGRFVPTRTGDDSTAGLTCCSCRGAIAHGQERCPECGDYRFEGTE
jgi:hypothetical protein